MQEKFDGKGNKKKKKENHLFVVECKSTCYKLNRHVNVMLNGNQH